ncbi:MAG: aldehyde ferredoxin oxidoreductase family protein [Dehalococcoidia bacterium]|nr:aldehyde ferredoxin oxidoreductase family protein [Dehalococcoidia bacterium]
MYGWAGTLLEIDLTENKVTKKSLDPEFARKWIGGEGFGAKILWDEVGPEVKDGLDPGNVLIFATGPLNGTMASASGRLEIVTKSPLTGIFGDSNTGGHLAPEIKQAGYDAVIVKGKAEKPVYIWIDDENVQIRNASHLWGKSIPETDEAIKTELRDREVQVSCIGPAGENLVRFAVIINNLVRAPGWVGGGAVAGSKNLKAVAVRGTKGIRIARPEEFLEACLESRRKVRKHPLFNTLRRIGTMYLVRQFLAGGYFPLQNFTKATCPPEYFQNINGEYWAENYTDDLQGCHGCEVHCGHGVSVKSGPYKANYGHGFEFGSLAPWISWYGSANLSFAIAAAKYCNENGIDGTEPGMLLAWATDCYKRGLLSRDETDGLELNWGSEAVAFEILRKIRDREGFGDLLADGLAMAAKKLGRGSEYYAQTIKGRPSLEAGVRGTYGTAIASATSTRGADHLKGWPHFEYGAFPEERSLKRWGHPKTGDGRSPEGKAPMTVYNQHIHTMIDLLGTCKFHTRLSLEGPNEDDFARLLTYTTGMEISSAELMTAAERVYNLERAYGSRLGITRKDDTLPPMYFKEPLDGGPFSGQLIQESGFNLMLDDYYRLRGWDVKTGIPLPEKLKELGMEDVAAELKKRGLYKKAK